MNTEQVVARIRQKDWTLLEQPGAIGPEAASAIQALLQDQNVEVRELAVNALAQAGGPVARKGLIMAVKDRSDMVRAAACRHLQLNYAAEDLPELTAELGSNPDEFVREQVGLVLGRIGSTNAIAPLARQFQKESDLHARQAISLALARLGEDANRQAYLQRLRQSDPKERALAVRDLLYVNDRKLVPQVLPLLDDLRPALNVGPSHGPYLIRVCDVTINVLDEFLKHPFSFKIEPARRYSEKEIATAKTVLAQIK
jgi:HEAT repeat protein